MQAKRTNHFISIVHGLIEFLGFFPFLLLIGVLLFPEPILYTWFILLFGLFAVFYLLKSYFSKRWYQIILAVILAMLVSFFIAPTIWAALVSVVLSFIAAFRGIQHAENDWDRIMPSRIFWAFCLPAYFVGYLIFTYVESLSAYQYAMSYMGFLFLIMMLFVTNRQQLQNETLSKRKKKVTKEVTRLNQFYLIITILAVFLLTNFQVIQEALMNGIRSVVAFIIWLVSLFGGNSQVEEEPPQNNSLPMLPKGEQEQSLLAEWLDRLLPIIGIILGFILLVILSSILFKNVRRIFIKVITYIWKKMKQIIGKSSMEEEQTDFSDQKENLFNWKKWREANKEKMTQVIHKITKRKPIFDKLTSEEKVRFLLRYLAKEVKKQEKWQDSLTAHEIIALTKKEAQLQQLKRWYDDIRYGDRLLPNDAERQVNQLWKELQEEK